MDTPSKSEDSEVNNFEQSEHDRGAVIQPDGSNVKTIDLETSATVVDMDSEKVVDQDFKEVQKEPRQEKDISEVSVILPVTPSEELKEPEGTATPEDVAASPTEPDAERPAEVQTAPDQEPQTETSSETALAPAEAPINELTPAPELTPVTEEAPQETPQTPAEATEPEKPTPAVAVDAGTPKVQKKPKKSDGSPDELVAKLDDILKVLEKKVGSAGASGKDMTEAKKAITEARDHFNNKRYKTAKELAVKVKQMVV